MLSRQDRAADPVHVSGQDGEPTPGAWCEERLRPLGAVHSQAPSVRQLERFLRHLIALDPPSAAFVDLLAEYACDSAPERALPAWVLLEEWVRTRDRRSLMRRAVGGHRVD